MYSTCVVLLYDCVTYIPKIAILKTLVGTDLYTLLYALRDYKKIDTNNISFYCFMKLCMIIDRMKISLFYLPYFCLSPTKCIWQRNVRYFYYSLMICN